MLRPLRISAEAFKAGVAEPGAAFADADAGAGVAEEAADSAGAEGASVFSPGATGRKTVNAEPPAGSASASMMPPCSRTMDMQMLRPSPVPPPGRLVV